jgi:hypothetical protein
MKLGVAPDTQVGKVDALGMNVPRGLPKYEVTKRLGCADMRGAPRLGVSVPRGTMVDECMGLFGRSGP